MAPLRRLLWAASALTWVPFAMILVYPVMPLFPSLDGRLALAAATLYYVPCVGVIAAWVVARLANAHQVRLKVYRWMRLGAAIAAGGLALRFVDVETNGDGGGIVLVFAIVVPLLALAYGAVAIGGPLLANDERVWRAREPTLVQ